MNRGEVEAGTQDETAGDEDEGRSLLMVLSGRSGSAPPILERLGSFTVGDRHCYLASHEKPRK